MLFNHTFLTLLVDTYFICIYIYIHPFYFDAKGYLTLSKNTTNFHNKITDKNIR